MEPLAWFHPGKPVVATKAVGKGRVVYAGTDLGLAANLGDPSGLDRLLGLVLARVGITTPGGIAAPVGRRVRIDHLQDRTGRVRFAVTHNDEETAMTVTLGEGSWRGLYDHQRVVAGAVVDLRARSADIFIAE